MKTSRQKVMDTFNHNGGNDVMWAGHPSNKTVEIYAAEWGIEPTREAVYTYLNDDCRWIPSSSFSTYNHPEGLPYLDPSWGMERHSLSDGGCLANAQTIADVEKYPWPDVKYFNLDKAHDELDKFQDKMLFTGMWSPFFHNVADFLGMENYFIMMYENPAVVHAITEHIVDFYVQANEKYFTRVGDRADVMFFGNDFGTQLDLLVSPENFREFVLPYIKRIIAVGKKYGKKIMLHSCGSIYRVIPDLIDAGVDILHPIQAQATGMSAGELAQYKNDLAFVGGLDAQSFFVNATPEQIRDEVNRVRDILGPSIVISPSHEEILPNVPSANVLSMANAARNIK